MACGHRLVSLTIALLGAGVKDVVDNEFTLGWQARALPCHACAPGCNSPHLQVGWALKNIKPQHPMPQEIETRVLDIDKAAIVGKLEQLGATKIKDVLQRRTTFDYPDRRLDAKDSWIRLRDTGDGVVELAYKCQPPKEGAGIAQCEEVEFAVPDMETVEKFLLLIGFERKSYQETKRIRYQLDDLTFDVDEWPLIPPFVEVEGPSHARVLEGVRLLGYDEKDTFPGSAGAVYEKHGIDWKAMKEIKF